MRVIWKFTSSKARKRLLPQLLDALRFRQSPEPVYPGSGYFHAVPKGRRAARRLVDLLRENSRDVTELSWEAAVTTPDGSGAEVAATSLPTLSWPRIDLRRATVSRDWRDHQIYLGDAGHGGIDALHAWTFAGGRGENVRLVDLEWGCDVEHEDLRVPLKGLDVPSDPHGTESLGVCVGDPCNRFGVVGIAHRARATLAPVERHSWLVVKATNVAKVLHEVTQRLSAGDVILLELQANYEPPAVPKAAQNLPVELSPCVREAIEKASDAGIYVIEPAGNGSAPLENYGLAAENRTPAIMVGAGHPLTHGHLYPSNFGERVDVQGWGMAVVTTGKGTLQAHQDRRKTYSQTFGDTSGAAAIVAGAVTCLSGIVKANQQPPLTPEAMRELLVSTGTPQGGEAGRKVGPLPNLKAAIAELSKRFGVLLPSQEQAA